ncbi:glycosyltransferase family 4 protein [Mongoliitalea daihaiensis]|uniref:glycosyltransferase family 4 protein n=1 Tax=Mongoliitalea daihaiensis TaxID=2782006 RepID=UPI001F46B630|nr:glycosyltransferase family 4 protein [Mongoliitalea daihaiensis]UJP64456.1 glycosyltransferase family 4 protein [Mongoliitalea daihaiensis]
MKVLFLMFAFPDMNKSFNMYTTLVEEFVNHGHEVTVVAPGIGKTGIYVENGIPVLRAQTLPIKNVPNYLKGISNVLLPFQFERALNQFYKEKSFDLVISPTPPITLVDLAAKIKRKFGNKFYLILRDIFPQNAVDLGFMKKEGLTHRYFRKKERKLYKEADYIGCMSQGNIDYVMKHNPEVSEVKLHELKNYQKPYNGFGSDPQLLKKKYGIANKFVVVFGGNMGKPQQLENVLVLAESVIQFPDIVFLLLGEGVQINKIEAEAKSKGLTNIKIQRTIPKQEYQDLLSVCDIGLISLHKDFTIPNIPSKALDYFNVGIPVLASLDRATDFGKILDEEQSGMWSYAGDHQLFHENLLKLYQSPDLKSTMGQNGNTYFKRCLTPEIAYNTILNCLN